MQKEHINIFWFRRDLRLTDNHGLYKALQSELPVLPLFIFDENILEELPKDDARVTFIYHCLQEIHQTLQQQNKGFLCFTGSPITIWKSIIQDYRVHTVFTNRDYEPYAQKRDKAVYELLARHQINFKGYKDHVIFEKKEILNQKNKPYTVFTPYAKRWRAQFNQPLIQHYKSELLIHNFRSFKTIFPRLSAIGFVESPIRVPPYKLSPTHIQDYAEQRNIPAKEGTSKLSPHLRFGTISIREVYRKTAELSEQFINELIWRDFYSQILYHFPFVVNNPFKAKYNAITWRNNETEFKKWCEGKTGFPIVDAGMRQLNQTGWMHNRVRMITASFLCKDLLIDWRWGEAYFAKKLLDYDLASNNGGWQWAAGTGTDAAPYFRIFNPDSQLKTYDPNFAYVKTWLPEWGTDRYPQKMVDHQAARKRALTVYKAALQ